MLFCRCYDEKLKLMKSKYCDSWDESEKNINYEKEKYYIVQITSRENKIFIETRKGKLTFPNYYKQNEDSGEIIFIGGLKKMDNDNFDYGKCEECGRELTEETTRECKYCSKLLCEWCIDGECCEDCKDNH